MDAFDVLRLQNVAYVQSQIACAMVELEAMKWANVSRREQGLSLAYSEEAYTKLIDFYQLGHNAVLTNLHRGL